MAVQNYTTYTESDPDGVLTVAAAAITVTNMDESTPVAAVYKDFTAGYFSGDLHWRCQFTTPAAGGAENSSFLYFWLLTNAVSAPSTIEGASGDYQAVFYFESSGGVPLIFLRLVENGVTTNQDFSVNLSLETKYYLDIYRDDNGGANGTGQYTVYICTGNYNDEAGFTLVDTLTRDCSAGEQNDFRYLYACSARQQPATPSTSGLIENHEDMLTGVPAELAASGGFTLSGTATLTAAEVAELAASGGFTLGGTATLTVATVAELAASGGFTLSGSATLTRAGWMRVLTDDDGVTASIAVARVGGGTRTLIFVNGLYTGYTDS